MKNILKALFIGIIILIFNVLVAIWGYISIRGLLNRINVDAGWLVIVDFILLLSAIAMVAFYIISQGALASYLIDISDKSKEKCDE